MPSTKMGITDVTATQSAAEASAKASKVQDKYNYVYTVIIVIGIGTVLPWNTFINANSVSAALGSISHAERVR